MRINLDTSVLYQLSQTFGNKAPQVLWNSLNGIHEKAADFPFTESLTYDEIVRRNAISRRLDVGLMESARDILTHLNRMTGKSFRPVDTNLKPIAILLKDYDKNNILGVIDNKVAKWKGTSMEDFLRPSTLFRPSNFEAYVNESVAPEIAEKNLSNELKALLED